MEQSSVAPDAYAVDNGLFTPTIIGHVEQLQKPWVADSEKNRILYHKDNRYNCESFNATLPPTAFKETTVRLGQREKTRWVFSCTVRIQRYGKVRLAIIYSRPDKQGNPIYAFTNMLWWNATKLLTVRLHRWDIEPLHEQIKQFLGAESSQLQTERGVRKHLTLVFVVNSLLKSIQLSSPIGELSIRWSENDMPTFGQRCRRVILEVFYDLMVEIHQLITTEKKKVTEILNAIKLMSTCRAPEGNDSATPSFFPFTVWRRKYSTDTTLSFCHTSPTLRFRASVMRVPTFTQSKNSA